MEIIKFSGELDVIVRDGQSGEILQCYTGKNLVVNSFMTAFGELFANGVGNYKITALKLGTGNTPPTINDADLEEPVFTKDCNSIIYSTSDKLVTATTTIETSEANGYVLQEAGLFANTGNDRVMLARKTFPAITKTNDLTLDFVWRIKVILS